MYHDIIMMYHYLSRQECDTILGKSDSSTEFLKATGGIWICRFAMRWAAALSAAAQSSQQ
jgi:hypothetical protein